MNAKTPCDVSYIENEKKLETKSEEKWKRKFQREAEKSEREVQSESGGQVRDKVRERSSFPGKPWWQNLVLSRWSKQLGPDC
jgi:hypothetical protein